MNKLEDYSLEAFIHTVKVISSDVPTFDDVEENVRNCVRECYTKRRKEQGKPEEWLTHIQVNPNILGGDLMTHTGFLGAMDTIMGTIGCDEYAYQRVDVALDCHSDECYKKFQKINRLLVTCLAEDAGSRNTYLTLDLFSLEQVSVAFKTRRFEVENYDKAKEMGTAGSHSRLELRLKEMTRLAGGRPLKEQLVSEWTRRLDRATTKENVWRTQLHCNEHLENIYRRDKDAFPAKFRSLTDFIIRYQDFIYSKRQLVDLLGRFPDEVENPVYRAEWHKKQYGIEYYSQGDINDIVAEVKRAMNAYFEA